MSGKRHRPRTKKHRAPAPTPPGRGPDDPSSTIQLNRPGAAPGPGATPAPPSPAASTPVVSIIVVTYNSAGHLGPLVESIRASTDDPYEIIFVDNASRDTTPAILATFTDAKVILNPENRGFTAATNQGIRASRGDFVVLLNPDTAVTPGWSRRMRAHAGPGVGAVGPLSNYVAGLQKLPLYLRRTIPGSISGQELARILAEDNGGVAQETRLLTGFCMMIPRAVITRAGLLDEDLFLGNDDLEYSWRLRREGYRLLVATDVFVYHKGQESFRTDPESVTSRLVEESTDCLYRKLEIAYGPGNVPAPESLWGISWFRPTAYRHGLISPEIAARAKLLAQAGNPLVPLAFFLDEGLSRVHVIGDGDRAALGLGRALVSKGAWPDVTVAAVPLPGSRCEVAIVLGSPGADALARIEAAAERGVIVAMPTSGAARAVFRARLSASGTDPVTTPGAPRGLTVEELMARGYDGVALPDFWGFDVEVHLMARWKHAADRARVREDLAAYYHPALLRSGAVSAPPDAAPGPAESPAVLAGA